MPSRDVERAAARRAAIMTGVRLGIFQAHALAGPPLALICLAFDLPVLAVLLGIGAGFGWAGWHRDFDLRFSPVCQEAPDDQC